MKVPVVILVILMITATPYAASAHGGKVWIELNVTQASPGAMIDLRGNGLEPGDTTVVMLVNAERQQLLAAATADDHGDLAQAVLLPVEWLLLLPVGTLVVAGTALILKKRSARTTAQ